MNKKQYTVEKAYGVNDEITTYVNGKIVSRTISPYWETQGYCSALKNRGYSKAYNVEQYKIKMEENKENYEFALEQYEMAKANPLIIGKDNNNGNNNQ